jgi:hypothetical protein
MQPVGALLGLNVRQQLSLLLLIQRQPLHLPQELRLLLAQSIFLLPHTNQGDQVLLLSRIKYILPRVIF